MPMVPPEYSNMIRLSFCALGICLSYWYYGVVQENLLTFSGLGATFLLVTQTVTNVLVAQLWQWVEQSMESSSASATVSKHKSQTPSKQQQQQQQRTSRGGSLHHSLLFLTSACYVFAMVCSNESLRFVPYPTAVLAKSCKLIPIMVIGFFVEQRSYSTAQWTSAILISAGIALFHLSRSSTKGNDATTNDAKADAEDESWKGMVLLLTSLAMDGLLGSCQGLLKRIDTTGTRRAPTAVETMLYINLYALLFLVPLAIYTGQWDTGIRILWSHPTLLHSISKLNGVVAMGQIFIFLTLTWFSSLVCTTITTTRKFFTILFSVFWFGHYFSKLQWVSVVLVFGGLYLSTATEESQSHQKGKIDASVSSSASGVVVVASPGFTTSPSPQHHSHEVDHHDKMV
jgi:solute carrier family 35 (UDP-galactose transporter), member B1